jgi:hypothetical protein
LTRVRRLARGDFGPFDLCAYDPQSGTALEKLALVLKLAKFNSTVIHNGTLDLLAEVTKSGYPAVAGIGRGSKMGHAIIVDYVMNEPRGQFILRAIQRTHS